jgi:hypothetical protein
LTEGSEALERAAARLALFAVRATLPMPLQSQQPAITFEGQPMALEDIVLRLSSIPKPIEVQLKKHGSGTVLMTRALSETEVLARSGISGKGPLAFLQHSPHPLHLNSIILCRLGSEITEVSLEVFRRWERSYAIGGQHSVSADFADSSYARVQGFSEAALSRASAVVVFGNPKLLQMRIRL